MERVAVWGVVVEEEEEECKLGRRVKVVILR